MRSPPVRNPKSPVRYRTIRSHPPPQAGCPLGDPGPLAVLTRTLKCWLFSNRPLGELHPNFFIDSVRTTLPALQLPLVLPAREESHRLVQPWVLPEPPASRNDP